MERTQLFSYDSFNRLATAETLHQNQPWWQGDSPTAECWGEQFNYDPWGNLTGISPVSSAYTGCTQENWSMSATTKNQLQDTNNDYVYDAAGNLIQPGPIGGPYVFDAENHLISADGMAYLYDGDGKRVGKAPANTPTQPNYLYWYGGGSQILQETDGAGNFLYRDLYFNGMLVDRQESDNWEDHFFLDALGNVRGVYGDGDPDGGYSDYYPFGGERPIPSCCPTNPGGVNVPFKFTGKERDSESGLDNFGARFNSSQFGRFLSPDPSMDSARLRNPQSWNRYAYTINNPLRYIDPDGELWVASGDSNNPYSWVDECAQNQTCYDSVGAVVGNSLRLYGSSNAQDITNIRANAYGMVDLNDIDQQHDAAFDVNSHTEYSYVSLQTGADFFNFIQDYQSNYPDAPNLYVSEAGADDGSRVPGHITHRDGKQIDLRYVNDDGRPIQNPEAYNMADADRMWDIFRMAHNSGMTQIYAGDDEEWGDYAHRPTMQGADPHFSHFHLSIPNPRPPRR